MLSIRHLTKTNTIIAAALLCMSMVWNTQAFAVSQKVSEYTLSNGMKVLVKEDHRAPVIVVQVWYKVGSNREPNGITGISHVLEHMMFQGTPKHPKGQFSKLVAQNGGKENAFTSADFTTYFQKLTSDKLAFALRLEADRMRNLLLDSNAFAKEIEVVKEERRMRYDDKPQSLLYEKLNAMANVASPYHHLTIGWMSDLQNMTNDDIKAWYKKFYAPNNAILVVVGDVKPEEVLRLANETFGALEKSNIPAYKPHNEAQNLGLRQIDLKIPAKLPAIYLAYNVPSLKTAKDRSDAFALEIIANLLSGGQSSRLIKNIVRGQNLATSAGAYFPLYSRFSGLLLLSAVPNKGVSTEKLQQALLAEVNKLKTKLVSDKELSKIKNQIIAQQVYKRDSMFGAAMEIGMLETIGLSWREDETFAKNIRAVTPEQIQNTAKKFLTENRLSIARLHPQPIKPGTKKQRAKPVSGSRHH